ncbi:mutator-like element transposase [Fusarium mundagurra]|uniref:Mutator-like element transposase n=1 Tax=Fusarium mundagurra TaxID=1567541 RepID=A0A8H6DF82_9HYPO|nr:mutator-like element transposase [Fusarium mundagurra]
MTSKTCPQRYEELLKPPAPTAQARPLPTTSSSALSLHAGEAPRPTSSGSSDQAESVKDSASCIIVRLDSADNIVPTSRYDDPRAIYQRYVAARDAWYKAQPRGSIKTNQQYRRALGLPLRYDKCSYQWCLDWKQMGKRCDAPNVSRDWTKEEMMAYLDWSKAEDDRVEAQVAVEMESSPFSSRRGMHDIWEAAAADSEAQQAIHSGR